MSSVVLCGRKTQPVSLVVVERKWTLTPPRKTFYHCCVPFVCRAFAVLRRDTSKSSAFRFRPPGVCVCVCGRGAVSTTVVVHCPDVQECRVWVWIVPLALFKHLCCLHLRWFFGEIHRSIKTRTCTRVRALWHAVHVRVGVFGDLLRVALCRNTVPDGMYFE